VFGDAASVDCAAWATTFRRAGFEAPIHAHRFDEHHTGICQPLDAYVPREDDLILFHYTTWTESADFLLRLGRPLTIMYHNVTPPEFFAGFDERAAAATGVGRARLAEFAPLAILGAAKSEFSRADLVEAGFARTCVVPVRLDFATLDGAVNRRAEAEIRAAGPGVLYVGRIVPNKRVEDLVRAFAHYHRRIEPRAMLYCVGAHTPGGRYQTSLDWLVRRLELDARVHFMGQMSNQDRGAFYRAARVFVTMSEHEGFCVPAIEAMHLGLPVVAFASGAVPETVGDAAVLIGKKRPEVTAEIISMLAADTPLRRRMIEKGRAWAERYRPEMLEAAFAGALSEALDAA
jgi:L-malate glycosyltransferase